MSESLQRLEELGKQIAQERHPEAKITLATSDAILIALFAKEEYYDNRGR